MGYVDRKGKNKRQEEKGERLGCGRCLEFGGGKEKRAYSCREDRAYPILFAGQAVTDVDLAGLLLWLGPSVNR